MSYTNKTTHYELPQYVATDKPKYLTDFNETMATIDGQMYTNATAAATAQTAAEGAQSTADGAVSSIGTLNTQINGDPTDPSDTGLAGDVSANTGSINTINSLIGNGTPTTTDKTIIGAINELDADLNGAGGTEAKIGDLSALTTTDKSSVVAAINEVDAKIGDLSTLTTTDKSSVVAAINEVDGKVSGKNIISRSFYGIADGVKTAAAILSEAYASFKSYANGKKFYIIGIDATGATWSGMALTNGSNILGIVTIDTNSMPVIVFSGVFVRNAKAVTITASVDDNGAHVYEVDGDTFTEISSEVLTASGNIRIATIEYLGF